MQDEKMSCITMNSKMLYTARSYYSLRYGTMPVETLVEEAAKRNIGTLALTDINNSSACFDFVSLCRKII
jgi:DNA polymerase III alpha subunit